MFGEPTPNGTMRTPFAFAAFAAAVAFEISVAPAWPSVISTSDLVNPAPPAASDESARAMPAACGLPVEDAGRPLTAATRAL